MNLRIDAMVLISGATGNVGRELVNVLLAEGTTVRAVSRNTDTAMLPSESQLIQGDPSRPQTLARALSGADAILLSPRALAGAAGELLTLAASNGVRRAVLFVRADRAIRRWRSPLRRRVSGNRRCGQGLGPGVDNSAIRRLRIEREGMGATDSG
jgi:NAD(P)-dependent dehydrogenase (short-subunit alcohol dehydrogenase family)